MVTRICTAGYRRPLRIAVTGAIATLLTLLSVDSALHRLQQAGSPVGAAGRGAAVVAVTSGDYELARTLAVKALEREPLDQRLLGIWGAAELADGHAAEALAVFAAAGALGWRDRATQRYIFFAALQSGDATVAAQRLDALLRMDGADRHSDILTEIEVTAAGRAALAQQLALSPAWVPGWIAQAQRGDTKVLIGRAEILYQGLRAGYAAPPAMAGGFVRSLFERGRVDEAVRVWDALGTGRSALELTNGFDDAKRWGGSPFTWTVGLSGDVDARVEGDGPGAELVAESVAATGQTAASRGLALAPGRYVLEWTVVALGDADRPMEATVRCAGGGSNLTDAELPYTISGRSRLSFTVPDRCAGQWVAFRVPASPGNAPHRIARPRITKV